jgi:hypothetical protein
LCCVCVLCCDVMCVLCCDVMCVCCVLLWVYLRLYWCVVFFAVALLFLRGEVVVFAISYFLCFILCVCVCCLPRAVACFIVSRPLTICAVHQSLYAELNKVSRVCWM